MSANIDAIYNSVISQSGALAKTLFTKFANDALTDTQNFLNYIRGGVARAIQLRAMGQIDDDDLRDLLLGKKELAAMQALKQAGLASAAIDTFVNGVLNILVDAVFKALMIA